MNTRRDFTRYAAAFASGGIFGGILGLPSAAFAARNFSSTLNDQLQTIERDSGGRLGVAILNTTTGERAGIHSDDRFPMCSTFKLLAAAAVLNRVEQGQEKLERVVTFTERDVVPGSTVIDNLAKGNSRTMGELCEAAMIWSDNTSGNLLLNTLGGPAGLTAYARSIGDSVTRLDRNEPTLNDAVPGDPRDTTTPSAMLKNIQTLVLGDALSPASKEQLTKWLVGNKTGDKRLRAELPSGWRCGDKTGSGERGTTNDAGLIWPPQGKPILVTIYLTETAAPADKRNATLAAVGRAIANTISI
jgi:beta-lactamase class A